MIELYKEALGFPLKNLIQYPAYLKASLYQVVWALTAFCFYNWGEFWGILGTSLKGAFVAL